MSNNPRLTPIRTIVVWILAGLAGVGGLVIAHCFDREVVPDAGYVARIALASCLGLFALSRLLMLVPACRLQERLSRWWVDYVLIVAAVIWRIMAPASEWFILHVGTAYVLIVGASALFRAMVAALSDEPDRRSLRRTGVGIVGASLLLVIACGVLLALPAFQRAHRAVESGHQLAWYQFNLEALDGMFTAATALTGTGLSVQDVGYHYTRVGQLVILVLMQVGGLGVLAVGVVVGLRLRQLLGWQGVDDDTSPHGLRRAVLWVCLFALIVEAIGAVGVYRMWDPAVDLNFVTAARERPLLGDFVRSQTTLGDRYDEPRIFAAIFHSVSAFCDAGLTLTSDGYMAYRNHPAPYLALMPLMLLGSLGGPVVLELLRRMVRRNRAGIEAISRDTIMTLVGVASVLVVGAGLLFAIESTRGVQLRYPQANTPGRIMVGTAAAAPSTAAASPSTAATSTGTATPHRPATGVIDFAAITAAKAQSERLNGLPTGERIKGALFQAAAAQFGGSRSLRLDENSLSPASHLVLIGLMFVGGGAGGATGGLRITIFILLLTAMLTGGRPRQDRVSPGKDRVNLLTHSRGTDRPSTPRRLGRSRVIALSAAMLTSLLLLVGLTTLILTYRESGSPLACLFESVSACCNVGLSTGLTAELSIAGKITLIVAMIAGRLIPLLILMRLLQPASAVNPAVSTSEARLKSRIDPSSPATSVDPPDDDTPIPLE